MNTSKLLSASAQGHNLPEPLMEVFATYRKRLYEYADTNGVPMIYKDPSSGKKIQRLPGGKIVPLE